MDALAQSSTNEQVASAVAQERQVSPRYRFFPVIVDGLFGKVLINAEKAHANENKKELEAVQAELKKAQSSILLKEVSVSAGCKLMNRTIGPPSGSS